MTSFFCRVALWSSINISRFFVLWRREFNFFFLFWGHFQCFGSVPMTESGCAFVTNTLYLLLLCCHTVVLQCFVSTFKEEKKNADFFYMCSPCHQRRYQNNTDTPPVNPPIYARVGRHTCRQVTYMLCLHA